MRYATAGKILVVDDESQNVGRVRRLDVFGSTRSDFDEVSSDVDLLVEFEVMRAQSSPSETS